MTTPLPQNKGQGHAQQVKFTMGRQTLGLGAVQIDGKGQIDRAMRRGRQDADAARLDPAADHPGAFGGDSAGPGADPDLVIRDKRRAERHHFKRKR